jgi:hypothetical protein
VPEKYAKQFFSAFIVVHLATAINNYQGFFIVFVIVVFAGD